MLWPGATRVISTRGSTAIERQLIGKRNTRILQPEALQADSSGRAWSVQIRLLTTGWALSFGSPNDFGFRPDS
jgi:hypothetical protein